MISRRCFSIHAASSIFAGLLPGSIMAQTQTITALSGHQFTKDAVNYRLVDITSPGVGDLNLNSRQYAQQSQKALEAVLGGDSHSVQTIGPTDRWGAQLCILVPVRSTLEEASVQLLHAGAVRVWPRTDDQGRINTYLDAEMHARAEKKGLWQLPWYRVRNANDVDDCDDTPGARHIFAGTIRAIGAYRGRRFLNFGTDYRTDVTASLTNRVVRQWEKQGTPIESLEGREVAFRGFVEWINGPSIAIHHPQQLIVAP